MGWGGGGFSGGERGSEESKGRKTRARAQERGGMMENRKNWAKDESSGGGEKAVTGGDTACVFCPVYDKINRHTNTLCSALCVPLTDHWDAESWLPGVCVGVLLPVQVNRILHVRLFLPGPHNKCWNSIMNHSVFVVAIPVSHHSRKFNLPGNRTSYLDWNLDIRLLKVNVGFPFV